MFVMIAIVAVILAWPVRGWRRVHHRRIVLEEVLSRFGTVMGPWPVETSRLSELQRLFDGVPVTEASWLSAIQRQFDDVSVVEIALIPDTTKAQLARVRAAFPEADVYVATDAGLLGANLRIFSGEKTPDQ